MSASISMLVNGSPTKEFNMGRGLRQDDPLSPFLFLLAAEGFKLLMRKAVKLGRFDGFKFDRGESFRTFNMSITLLLFELISGLKVNSI
jgi:hypothetical protein